MLCSMSTPPVDTMWHSLGKNIKLHEIKIVGFLITKIWQILKRSSRALSWAQTSYFWRVCNYFFLLQMRSKSNQDIYFPLCFQITYWILWSLPIRQIPALVIPTKRRLQIEWRSRITISHGRATNSGSTQDQNRIWVEHRW